VLPDVPNVPMRIEAAAWQGKPVSWRLVVLSSEGPANFIAASLASPTIAFSNPRAIALFILVIVGAALFARRNLRMGRGDRRGAMRLGCFIFILLGIEFVFREHFGSILIFLVAPILGWLMYIAFEPFVRRHWPGMLVGWSRLIAGSYRDTLVGRDLLAGCASGVVVALLPYLAMVLSSLCGAPQASPRPSNPIGSIDTLYFFSSSRAIIAGIASVMYVCISYALAIGFLLFLLRTLFRSTWAAAILCILAYVAVMFPKGNTPLTYHLLLTWLMPLVLAMVIDLFMILRFGLLALIAEKFFCNLLDLFPITTQTSAWYFGIGLAGLAVFLMLALYAFQTSLGGQPMFGRASLED
jgi:hypothetical protein